MYVIDSKHITHNTNTPPNHKGCSIQKGMGNLSLLRVGKNGPNIFLDLLKEPLEIHIFSNLRKSSLSFIQCSEREKQLIFQLVNISPLASMLKQAKTSFLHLEKKSRWGEDSGTETTTFSPVISDRVIKVCVQKLCRDGQRRKMCARIAGDCWHLF